MPEPHEVIAAYLQSKLTDYNTGRSTSQWIYTRHPEVFEMKEFPIVVVSPVGEVSEVAGVGVDDTWDTVQIEISVITRRDVFVSGMENEKLVNTICRDIKKVLRTGWKNDIQGFYNFTVVNNTPVPYDEANMLYKRVMTVQFNLINAGE